MLIHKQQLRNTVLNDNSSHLGCHATSKGYAVPDILKYCRAFRMSGPSSRRKSHMQQHSTLNQETLIFSDTAVGTSNARMINERGWKAVCCVAVRMQVRLERSAVRWARWDQSGCFCKTIVPQSQTHQQLWNSHWSDRSDHGCYRHLVICPPHSWNVYVLIPGGWDPQISVLLWNTDNAVQWSEISCQ